MIVFSSQASSYLHCIQMSRCLANMPYIFVRLRGPSPLVQQTRNLPDFINKRIDPIDKDPTALSSYHLDPSCWRAGNREQGTSSTLEIEIQQTRHGNLS
jgi:hypothetical protein